MSGVYNDMQNRCIFFPVDYVYEKALKVLKLKVDHKLVGEALSIDVEMHEWAGKRGKGLIHCLDELGLQSAQSYFAWINCHGLNTVVPCDAYVCSLRRPSIKAYARAYYGRLEQESITLFDFGIKGHSCEESKKQRILVSAHQEHSGHWLKTIIILAKLIVDLRFSLVANGLFLAIEVLRSMTQPNMGLLLGACPEYGCLVYKYMEIGSLKDRLFR
ncbi:hypothetical protein POM88_032216 [Heracleum sosnowskyi]|uniref:RING-type E3 ubiquitin transferase n=1 Tax=Heracleum sosnowskyi TaxID=360622 RepID=A0AAD8ML14_9APIA|nr:hypothetical protein POM88_032216 [Heracleum sosnowskyi]